MLLVRASAGDAVGASGTMGVAACSGSLVEGPTGVAAGSTGAGAGRVSTSGGGPLGTGAGSTRGAGALAVAAGCRDADIGAGPAQALTPIAAATHSGQRAWAGEGAIEGEVAVATDQAEPAGAATLYVVATPLGNLRDITLRALAVLEAVDVIAAEDTRVTAKLLASHGIAARAISVHEHNESRRAREIIALLGEGKSVALVSDAGTPGVSDPGAKLVRAVTDAGFAVVPIPGASAAVAALSASGIETPHWLFCGFLPASAAARRSEIEALRELPCALVFYEAPHRIAATVDGLAAVLGPEREIVIARELTKRFESIHRCRLGDAAAWLAADPDRLRGEFVLIVDAPIAAARVDGEEARHERTLALLLSELPLAQAVRLAAALTGVPRKRLYARALVLKATP